MSLYGKELIFTNPLINFFTNCDYLIGNFEGILTEKKGRVLFPQNHSEKVLQNLKELKPLEKTVFCCANNHSADFGKKVFEESYQKLKDQNILVIGKKEEPSTFLLDTKINLVNVSFLSNQPTNFIAGKEAIQRAFNEEAEMNILLPHWGYELQLYPHPNQIQFSQLLLKKRDAIVGTHSHCPQPISSLVVNGKIKIVAFSLEFLFWVEKSTISSKRHCYENGDRIRQL